MKINIEKEIILIEGATSFVLLKIMVDRILQSYIL
jgi:hypothetical protein